MFGVFIIEVKVKKQENGKYRLPYSNKHKFKLINLKIFKQTYVEIKKKPSTSFPV